MERLQLTSEVTTPLFCSGANQQRPEIRLPSIRGAMRFWFRALVGARVGKDLVALQRLESAVFGTTERASMVIVRTHASQLRAEPFEFRDPYLQYLGFGLFRTQDALPRSSVAPGTKFDIELLSSDTHALHQAAAALWFLLTFAGIGARSRRGWGSHRVTGQKGVDALKFILPIGSELKNRIHTMGGMARRLILPENREVTGHVRNMPLYPTLLSNYWRMKLIRANEQ